MRLIFSVTIYCMKSDNLVWLSSHPFWLGDFIFLFTLSTGSKHIGFNEYNKLLWDVPVIVPCENNCGKYYTSVGTMLRHKRLDCGNIKKFTCTICEKTFKRKYHLKRHFNTHISGTRAVENDDGNDEEVIGLKPLLSGF